MLLYFLFALAGLWGLKLWIVGTACITESRLKIPDVLGYQIEIGEKNCDLVAKDDYIEVYASRPGSMARTLLMEYDPASGKTLPEFKAIGENQLEISLDYAGSISFLEKKMGDVSIRYKIKEVWIEDKKYNKKNGWYE